MMLDSKGFDSWCKDYDHSVSQSEQSHTYPFAGYNEVLNSLYRTVCTSKPGSPVLDIGFGTGILTQKLYEAGYKMAGIDFSPAMVESAQQKMPQAILYCHDFTHGLPRELQDQSFDFILSTYAFHHLTHEQKVQFLVKLKKHLLPGGQILIGDVAFATRADHNRCRAGCGESWDSDESYLIFDELCKAVPALSFTPFSFCSGIVKLKIPE